MGHAKMSAVASFDEYLRPLKDNYDDISESDWIEFRKDLASSAVEAGMYPILAKLLTRICISVCEPGTFTTGFRA